MLLLGWLKDRKMKIVQIKGSRVLVEMAIVGEIWLDKKMLAQYWLDAKTLKVGDIISA